jgi:hypothetical protein
MGHKNSKKFYFNPRKPPLINPGKSQVMRFSAHYVELGFEPETFVLMASSSNHSTVHGWLHLLVVVEEVEHLAFHWDPADTAATTTI